MSVIDESGLNGYVPTPPGKGSEIRERAKGIDQLIEAHWYAAYYQGLEHRNHDDEKGSAQKSEIALRTFITDLPAELERVENSREAECAECEKLACTEIRQQAAREAVEGLCLTKTDG